MRRAAAPVPVPAPVPAPAPSPGPTPNSAPASTPVLDTASASLPPPTPTAVPLLADLADALHAEWTKLRTVAVTAWLLAAAVVLTVGLSAASAATVTCDGAHCGEDPATVGLLGVMVGQAVVAVLAVLVVGEEYGTGMIRVTLVAMPRRAVVLAAKATIVAAVTAVAGVLAVLASALIALALLPGNGFTPANGYAHLATATTLRAAVGSVLYLVLIALLSIGLTALLRDSAAAVGTVLGLLYLFPVLAQVISNPVWHRHALQLAPMQAGLDVQATINVASQPLSPWQGLGVLALWAFGALGLGGLVMRMRDA